MNRMFKSNQGQIKKRLFFILLKFFSFNLTLVMISGDDDDDDDYFAFPSLLFSFLIFI